MQDHKLTWTTMIHLNRVTCIDTILKTGSSGRDLFLWHTDPCQSKPLLNSVIYEFIADPMRLLKQVERLLGGHSGSHHTVLLPAYRRRAYTSGIGPLARMTKRGQVTLAMSSSLWKPKAFM